jgi:murein endopeptidase
MQRSWLSALVIVALGPLQAGRADAVPPPGAAVPGPKLALSRWVEHRVIRGERLAEIATRYGVEASDIAEWNELDAARPALRAGQQLRIFTDVQAKERKRRSYTVREGDSWAKIARRFDVTPARLRDWNPGAAEPAEGDRLVIWVDVDPSGDDEAPGNTASSPAPPPAREPAPPPAREPAPPPVAARAPASTAAPAPPPAAAQPEVAAAASTPAPSGAAHPLPLVEVPRSGHSVGTPSRGRLQNGVQLPRNDALYAIRNLEHSWGSSHTVEQLQRAIARFRGETGFDRELLICDMSRRYGGRFRPHRSHTSGRDIDVQLPTKRGVAPGVVPMSTSLVDWDATWSLIEALIATGEVRYIFLSRSRQRPLFEAALRAGVDRERLRDLIQYPFHNKTAFVRHSSGHVKHLHVRFACSPEETRCREL